MGIHNFTKWLKTTYPESVKQITYQEYDNVFIDINPILHSSITKAKTEKDLLKRIIWLITDILKRVRPKKNLVLSTDGIPSLAKIILQKERRISMVKSINNINEKNFISPLILTPGTDFMEKLPELLNDYFDELRTKYKSINITSLITEEYGESEFKLFNKMRQINKNKSESNILLSNDADVIVMALSIVNIIPNIYIGHTGKIYEEINLDKFLKCLKNNKGTNLDYTLLMLLMGNDYIPKLNFITLNKLLPAYNSLNLKLVEEKDNNLIINNIALSRLLLKLINKNINFKLSNINFCKINNYLEGLTWCLNDYHNSKTNNMLYMYKYKKLGIDPVELFYFLISQKNISYPQQNDNIIINKKIYPAIVLPYKIKFLVKNNLCDKIFTNYKEFYDEELCIECKNYHKQISDLCASRKYLEDTDQDTNIVKKNISEITKTFCAHKKSTHKRIKYKKYIEIINFLKQ